MKSILSVLGTAEHPAPVHEDDVLRLKVFLKHDEEARITLVNGLREGDRVQVSDGPFASYEGPIIFLDEQGRLRIDIFGRSVPVDMDLDQVRKVG